MNYAIDNVQNFISECCECHYFYVNMHMSLRDVSRETSLSYATVKRRLDGLRYFDDDMYYEYVEERSKRHAGRKQKDNKRS
jgi:hypothetical protein